jgi:hypothetical protein
MSGTSYTASRTSAATTTTYADIRAKNRCIKSCTAIARIVVSALSAASRSHAAAATTSVKETSVTTAKKL